MNIGLIGYYNQDNYGDDRILACVKQVFCDDTIVVTTGGYDRTKLNELNQCDFVLLGGGGIVRPNMNRFAPMIQDITTRFGCIGLGIETRDGTNDDLVTAIEDKAEFIYVRDRGSAALLNNKKEVIIGGDITFANPFPVIDPPVNESICGVNLVRSNLLDEHAVEVVIELIRSYCDYTVGLSFFDKEGDSTITKQFITPVERPLLEQFMRCRFIVGMRFHSAVLAIQMGIPFVSIPYRSKNRRLCYEAGLGYHIVELANLHALCDKMPFFINNYDMTRNKIIAVRKECIQMTNKAVTAVKKAMKK